MTDNTTERRLVAILAADVVGYSKLMGQDEAGTLAALRRIRSDLVDPRIAEHKGRLFKTTGDGLMVEFPSVVNAVACAVAIQKTMATQNADLPEDRLVQFRMGVNLGDVIAEGGDLFGDGVNVAARLEGLAPPNGIVVSAMVKDNIGNRLDLQFEDMGKQSLKNIVEPLQTYRVLPLAFKTPKVAALGQGKSSIAVLPFMNLSGDSESETFADGLTEDIITALSYCGNLLVIARTSVFAYKGKTGDVKRVGQELNVNYVMEGSVRRSMDRIRVTAQLIEAATGHHVWAEKYDGKLENSFDIQDEITRAVAASTNAQVYLAAWHARRRHAPGTDRAHSLASAAIGRMLDTNAEAFLEGTRLADEAFEADPSLPMARFARTFAFLFRLGEGIVPHTPEAIAQGLEWADDVLRLAPNDENSHWIKGWALAEAGRMEEAVTECEIGVSINPNVPMLLGDLGLFNAALGNAEDAIAANKLAIRISPRDPAIIWRRYGIAYAQFILEQYEDICLEMKRIAQSTKGFTRAGLLWAASAAAVGRMEEAGTAIRHCLAERPQLRICNFSPQFMMAYVRPQHQARLVELLRKAGLPE